MALCGVWDLFDPPDPTENELVRRLERVSAYKWIEYTFSASLMHVVVSYSAGISSSHELILSVCLFGGSMLTTNMANATLSRAEKNEFFVLESPTVVDLADNECRPASTCQKYRTCKIRRSSNISIQTRVDNEMPFLFLSFFAKGVLCVALTLPWIFIEQRDSELRPTTCTEFV